jgi:hypothetical protein
MVMPWYLNGLLNSMTFLMDSASLYQNFKNNYIMKQKKGRTAFLFLKDKKGTRQ